MVLVGNDHAVHRRNVTLAGHVAQELARIVEADDPAREVGERESARCEERQRFFVRGGVDAERTEDAQLLVDDLIGVEARRSPAAAGSGDHDGAAPFRELHGLRERGGRLGGDVDHDVGQPAGGVAQCRNGIGRLDVDREVGAELACDCRARSRRGAPSPVTMTKLAPAFLAAAAAEMPRTPGPSTATTSPRWSRAR